MISSKIRLVLLLLAIFSLALSFLFVEARLSVKDLQERNEELKYEVSAAAEERAYLVDEIFNLNSELQNRELKE